jgi:hypothetical protein
MIWLEFQKSLKTKAAGPLLESASIQLYAPHHRQLMRHTISKVRLSTILQLPQAFLTGGFNLCAGYLCSLPAVVC